MSNGGSLIIDLGNLGLTSFFSEEVFAYLSERFEFINLKNNNFREVPEKVFKLNTSYEEKISFDEKLYRINTLNHDLNNWMNRTPTDKELQNKKEAKKRILDSVWLNSNELDLSDLGLTSFPDILLTNASNPFYYINNLETFHLSGNNFSEIPESIILNEQFNITIDNVPKINETIYYLNDWIKKCDDSEEKTRREKAKELILDSMRNNLATVNLENFNLTSSPPLAPLPKFGTFDISGNNLPEIRESQFEVTIQDQDRDRVEQPIEKSKSLFSRLTSSCMGVSPNSVSDPAATNVLGKKSNESKR